MQKEVYSICFGCSVRCPIRVVVEDDRVKWLEGNPHVAGMEGSLCPRGMAGIALLYDHERVQSPMIRTGPRGSGKWKKASWDEALNFVADRLRKIINTLSIRICFVWNKRKNIVRRISSKIWKKTRVRRIELQVGGK